MRNYEYEIARRSDPALDGIFSEIKKATKKITKVALGDPKTILNITKGSLTNPIKQIKKDSQVFVDVHAKPLNAATLKLGPQRSAMLATIVAFIPVAGPVAAAAIAASSTYNQYKAQKTAAQLNAALQRAYNNFETNFSKLSPTRKTQVAHLLKSSEGNSNALDAIVIALDDATRGDNAKLNALIAKLSPLKTATTVKKTVPPPVAPESQFKKYAPMLVTAGAALLLGG